ncbi:uncharacterized protein LOC119456294 isoform X2 [Dermacentor silvarum]|uniref:uncharacterized protein LOC119456294 isoform X2 n=1 Tax=Dermacentor silvarum TaxID=543639 RepID=UPI0018993A47|nr:uncharacterized protein LOC119456294 isoform X2 [Dermacentor silvarum]
MLCESMSLPSRDGLGETTFLDVNVRNPIVHQVKGDVHTSYDISIETNNSSFTMSRSTVRRRYSEFIYLKSLLKELQPSLTPPRLPPKTLMKRFDDKFIEDRRAGLESFLRNVLTEPLYLSNKSLHLFIQTSLTMKEIEDVVKGTEGTYIPESKPPIVLSLHDEVFDEIGDSAYESAAEELSPNGSATAAPRGILRKNSSFTMLHSSKCCRGDGHCHLRIGSSICVCTPTLLPPSWDSSHDSGMLQSPYCPLPSTSTPIPNGVASDATTGTGGSNIGCHSGGASPDLRARITRLRASASDSCLETMGSSMKKHVSFSSAVEIFDREKHGRRSVTLWPPVPAAFGGVGPSLYFCSSSPSEHSSTS